MDDFRAPTYGAGGGGVRRRKTCLYYTTRFGGFPDDWFLRMMTGRQSRGR